MLLPLEAKLHPNIPAETIQLVKDALSSGRTELAKSISIATGLTWYDLMAPAKNLYPTITPLRNAIPRVHRQNPGTAANWKVVQALTGSGWDAMGWVPEGQRSARMSYTVAPAAAAYVTIGEEDQLSFEAEAAGVGFEDVNATLTMRLLQKTMRKEEMGLLAGNATLLLGTPVTPTLSASGAGATLPALTYSVIVVALTLEGFRNSNLAAGVATSKNITGADGNTFTLNGGSSQKSAAATQAVTLGQTLFATTTPIQGAVAYAWFTGAAGSEKLEQITTIASAAFAAPLVGGARQAATAVTADCSANPNYAFDGLLTQALKPSNLAYINILANGVAGTGTPLTSSGRGSVNEIDVMLQQMWELYKISPTVIYVNSQEQKNITTKVLSNASGPLLRYDLPATLQQGEAYGITAGGVISYYYNPFAVDGGQKIPIKIHPDLPPGTIIGYAERLPEYYQSNEVPNVAEILTRREYYRIDWPLRTRQREYGVYAEEVLAVYATFAMGVISNIANG